MQHTKEAKLAAIASVLLAASIFGGLSIAPALAQVAVASQKISQGDDESTTIAAVDVTGHKATTRTSGTLTINVVQNGTILGSAGVSAEDLTMADDTVTTKLDDSVTVQGPFEINAEFEGIGLVMVSDLSVAENSDNGTETAGGDGSNDNGSGDQGGPSVDLPDGLQIATIGKSQADDQKTTIDEVTMDVRKATTRTTGDLIVAIVQDTDVLAVESTSVKDLDMELQQVNVTFDSVDVTGDYSVKVLFDGAGLVIVSNIAVNGDTSTSEDNGSGDNGSNPPPGMVQLTVEAVDQNGAQISGLWVAVMNGTDTAGFGYTKTEFNLTKGQYTVYMDDFSNGQTTYTFTKWADSTQGKARTESFAGDDTFTAVYSVQGASSNPPPDSNPPPTGDANTVTVRSQLLDGTPLTGMQAQLRDSAGNNDQVGFTPATLPMESGQDYRVIMYSFNNNYFRNWADGGLHRYHAVSGDGDAHAFTANYEHIDDAHKAKLEILAKTADGQPIGGTTGRSEDGTLQAEPGVEVQIAPPGSMNPYTAYTAGYSGGSEIEEQFYFLDGQTYVVLMQSFGNYQFSHWEDNGSTNSARAVPLNGDTTLTAIYDVVQ